jgi:hypothetical protein
MECAAYPPRALDGGNDSHARKTPSSPIFEGNAMTRSIPLIAVLLLAGCGVEVAATAAVAAKTQVDAARQAEETQANIQKQLDAAAQIEKQKLEQAEAGTRP